MENLNAEQVKKALECCTSGNSVSACMSGCPLYEKEDCECINDDTALLKYALALINSQEQRIKELAEENEKLKKILSSVARFDTSLLCAWCREEQTKKIAKERLEGEYGRMD